MSVIIIKSLSFSTRTLTNRLEESRKNGIIERYQYNEIPPRVEYGLTLKGQELAIEMAGLLKWMPKWTSNIKAGIRTY